MALSAGAANQGKTTSRIINQLNYALSNVASDITTAATGDIIPMLDASDDYALKYADSANAFELLGVTATAATINAGVVGVAAGYKIARAAAAVALDGSTTSVAHGLTTCIAAFAQLKGTAAPGDSTSVLTCNINGANIDVYAWKHTTGGAAGNPTLIASTGTEDFYWFAVGT